MRLVLGVQYDGTHYKGFQSQASGLPTIQDYLEMAISRVADHPVKIICAGRTDSGVHALNQVVHFDTTANREDYAWVRGTNANLPKDIRISWAKLLDEDFHARYTAIARRYRYCIYNNPIPSALSHHRATWYFYPLNEADMQEAADFLIGEHDFTSYRGINCQAKSAIRTISHFKIERHGDFVILDVMANAFLHHMVRNMAGVLLAIGSGKYGPNWAKEVLAARDRKQACVTAPPNGLYLAAVIYPGHYDLPSGMINPIFFG